VSKQSPVAKEFSRICTVGKDEKAIMDFHNQLTQFIHPSRVLTSYLHRIAYANDASYFRLVPQAVVQPNSIGEIQALFKFTQ